MRWGDIFLKLMGFKTDLEIDYNKRIERLVQELYKKDKIINDMNVENSTFILCPNLRGKRFDKIIFPKCKAELNEWIRCELLPTLSIRNTVVGNPNFLERIEDES